MSDALIENLNVKCLFTALWMVLLSELDSSILCVLLSFRSKLCVAESIKKKKPVNQESRHTMYNKVIMLILQIP